MTERIIISVWLPSHPTMTHLTLEGRVKAFCGAHLPIEQREWTYGEDTARCHRCHKALKASRERFKAR